MNDFRTRLRSFSPVFPVRDLPRALAHYGSLGFDAEPYADGDEYGFADRDGVSLHLSLDPGGLDHGHEHVGTAYLYVADADALYDECPRRLVGMHRPASTRRALRQPMFMITKDFGTGMGTRSFVIMNAVSAGPARGYLAGPHGL
jgi:hypothetical protein